MVKNNNDIAILLSTYNAGSRLDFLINSLYAQTKRNWSIFVHDDFSNDGTNQKLEEYAKIHDNFFVLNDNVKRGACYSFLWLLQNVDSHYYMFCDQDDIWLPCKIDISYSAIKGVDENIPTVVNTDLAVVDSQYNIEKKSLWEISKVSPQFLSNLKYMSLFPFVTGCTMLFNRAAKNVTNLETENIPMHDWWICINVLKQKGQLTSIKKSTILYCQHGNNTVGALNVNLKYAQTKISNIRRIIKVNKNRLSFINKNITYMSVFSYLRIKLVYSLIRLFI